MFITEFHTFERHGMLRKKSKVKYNVSFLGRELKMINYKYEPPFRKMERWEKWEMVLRLNNIHSFENLMAKKTCIWSYTLIRHITGS